MANIEMKPGEIQGILEQIKDEKQKTALLKSIYIPGNQEIAELLIPYDYDIQKKELLFALTTKDEEQILKRAKRYIDKYIDHGHEILLKDEIKKFNNSAINAYILEKIEQNPATDIETLEGQLYLLEGIGDGEKIKDIKEKILKLKLQDKEYPTSATSTLTDLGRYEEAIDLYLKNFSEKDYYTISCAWNIAKESAPQRQKEIAEIVMKYPLQEGWEKVFYECATFLGKEDIARTTITKRVNEVLYEGKFVFKKEKKIQSSARFFEDIAGVMYKLGGFEKELAKLSKQLETYTNEQQYPADSYKEMAHFYNGTENKEKSLEWFGKLLDYQIKECHPSHAQGTFKEIEKMYGLGYFEEKQIDLQEKMGMFNEAAELAKKLGLDQKAAAYTKIAEIMKEKEGIKPQN